MRHKPFLLIAVLVVLLSGYSFITTGLDIVREPQRETATFVSGAPRLSRESEHVLGLISNNDVLHSLSCPSSRAPRATRPVHDAKCLKALQRLTTGTVEARYVEIENRRVIVELAQTNTVLYSPADTVSLRNQKVLRLALLLAIIPIVLFTLIFVPFLNSRKK